MPVKPAIMCGVNLRTFPICAARADRANPETTALCVTVFDDKVLPFDIIMPSKQPHGPPMTLRLPHRFPAPAWGSTTARNARKYWASCTMLPAG